MKNPVPELKEFETPLDENWRSRFLHNIFIGSAIIGIIALVPAILSTDIVALRYTYAAVYLVLVSMIFLPLPYTVRAFILSFLLFGIGFASMTEAGIRGDSALFLLSAVAMAGLLLGTRAGIGFVILNEILIIVLGALVISGQYVLMDPTANPGGISDWVAGGMVHILLSWVILGGLRLLQRGFEQAYEHSAQMTAELREERLLFEERVDERTNELQRRSKQLNATTIVARQTAEIQDLDILLNNAVNLISEQFGFYHAGVFLINERGDQAVLQAASSDGGQIMLERGHKLQVGQGIVGYVCLEKKPRIALDVGADAVFFNNPDLPETRSEVALPLIVRSKLIGVLDIQSTEAQAFTQEDLSILQTLADQIAIAIENVRLLAESQLVIAQLQFISEESTGQNWQAQLRHKKPAYKYTPTGLEPLKGETQPNSNRKTLEIPLILRNRQIGKIKLQRKPNMPDWSNQEQSIVSEVASQTALALDNARLIDQTRERAQREQAIAGIATRMRETLDLETVLRTSARELQQALDLEEAEVRLELIKPATD